MNFALGDEFPVGLVDHEISVDKRNFGGLGPGILGLDVAFPKILRLMHVRIGVNHFEVFPQNSPRNTVVD